MAEKRERPIKDYRSGNVRGSIWRKKIQKDGRTRTRYSVCLKKQIRKQDGSYEDTSYFFPDELPRLITVAESCYRYTVISESKDLEEFVPA